MREFTLTIPPEYSGLEIKTILKNHFKFSAKAITRLKRYDGILLNGKSEFVIKKVSEGDFLKITFKDSSSLNIVPNDIPLDILYEDEDILAVNKPRNMPTHPSFRHFEGTLANACMHYFADTPFTFRAVTRLDRDTSGIVVIAKNEASAAKLSDLMQNGSFKKAYFALCTSAPTPLSGIIDAPIKREKEGIIKRCISTSGKKSVSEYETTDIFGSLALIKLHPITGRTHQLRVHLAHIGCPIYGDYLYGKEIPGEAPRLHCHHIIFPHPISGKQVELFAPLPDDMKIKTDF